MITKQLALSSFAAAIFTAGALAGQPMADGKDFKAMPEPCINDTELQVDIFGSYTDGRAGGHSDGFGGGVAVNYFFMRFLGVGVDGNLYDGDANGLWNVSGRLIARYPIDSLCLVPYAFVAGGVQSNGTTEGTIGAGGGLEYRVIPQKLGIFSEGRYTWSANDNDAAQVRVGVRVVF